MYFKSILTSVQASRPVCDNFSECDCLIRLNRHVNFLNHILEESLLDPGDPVFLSNLMCGYGLNISDIKLVDRGQPLPQSTMHLVDSPWHRVRGFL